MATTQQTDLIDIIDENEEVFATIEAVGDDAEDHGLLVATAMDDLQNVVRKRVVTSSPP